MSLILAEDAQPGQGCAQASPGHGGQESLPPLPGHGAPLGAFAKTCQISTRSLHQAAISPATSPDRNWLQRAASGTP